MMKQEGFAPGVLNVDLGELSILPLINRELAYPLVPWLMKPYTSCLDLMMELHRVKGEAFQETRTALDVPMGKKPLALCMVPKLKPLPVGHPEQNHRQAILIREALSNYFLGQYLTGRKGCREPLSNCRSIIRFAAPSVFLYLFLQNILLNIFHSNHWAWCFLLCAIHVDELQLGD